MGEKEGRNTRVLSLFVKLSYGDILKKKEEARHYQVTERTIQRIWRQSEAFWKKNARWAGTIGCFCTTESRTGIKSAEFISVEKTLTSASGE